MLKLEEIAIFVGSIMMYKCFLTYLNHFRKGDGKINQIYVGGNHMEFFVNIISEIVHSNWVRSLGQKI